MRPGAACLPQCLCREQVVTQHTGAAWKEKRLLTWREATCCRGNPVEWVSAVAKHWSGDDKTEPQGTSGQRGRRVAATSTATLIWSFVFNLNESEWLCFYLPLIRIKIKSGCFSTFLTACNEPVNSDGDANHTVRSGNGTKKQLQGERSQPALSTLASVCCKYAQVLPPRLMSQQLSSGCKTYCPRWIFRFTVYFLVLYLQLSTEAAHRRHLASWSCLVFSLIVPRWMWLILTDLFLGETAIKKCFCQTADGTTMWSDML